ncbi:MAG: putative transcriptional regulator, partial [Vicingaceae bacterium]
SKAYDFVDGNASLEELAEVLNKQNPAVLVRNRSNEVDIITIHDIISAINPKS